MKITITCECGETIESLEFENGYDTSNVTDACKKCGTKIDVELRISVATKEVKNG